MKTRLLLFALFFTLVCNGVIAADIAAGSDRAAVIKQWGQPNSRMALGKDETLIYDKNFQVYLKNGKVTGFKNLNLAPAGSPEGALTASAAAASLASFELQVPDLSNYKIPRPTIYSDPSYRVRGSWGGQSDGKTIGTDGKPLADHHQYANDSSEFLKLIRQGVKLAMPTVSSDALSSLYSIHRANTPKKRKAAEAYFRQRYKMEPTKSGLHAFAGYVEGLQAAVNSYQGQKGHLNYEERLRVKDRIDLDKAKTPKGLERRRQMKAAVWRMEQYRKLLMAKHGDVFNASRTAKAAEDSKIAAAEKFATVAKQDALMFLCSKFERTPLLEGLAQAAEGKVHEYAKPVLLPKGVKVQIVENRTIEAPAKGGRAAMSLKVSSIKIKNPNVRQLNGAKLNMTFLGWVLDKDLVPVGR